MMSEQRRQKINDLLQMQPLPQCLINDLTATEPQLGADFVDPVKYIRWQLSFHTMQARVFIAQTLAALIQTTLLSAVIRVAAWPPWPRRGKHINGGAIFGLG